MKPTLALLFTILAFSTLQAQEKVDPAAVEKAVDKMAQQYQLNAEQREQAAEIQTRRLRNLAEIAPLQKTAYKQYLQKKHFIREATQASLRRMLTPEQMPILKQQLLERRKQESKLIERLKAEGASQEDIQIAIWELD
ncbi:MAG: hypothetical protein GVY26_13695 [Bacteroidetes bacterium]|jgi:phenylacetate-coenzyme A ligase PaaK-like adenylate-forming protein|nr:hypothetical protein [Bacteroidota bacterium]